MVNGTTSLAGLSAPILGTIVPVMGTDRTRRTGLADALFTPVQQRLLALLFGQPDRRFQSAELIRLVGSGTGAVHRQLRRLADAGLVTVTRVGNQKHYQASRDTPIFSELHGLVVKTVGVVEPLRASLAPLADRIEAAFVFGSLAKRTDRAGNDVDLLVISADLAYPEVYEALQQAERILTRAVNPTVMTPAQWRDKRARHDSFVARVADQPKLFVLGVEDAFAWRLFAKAHEQRNLSEYEGVAEVDERLLADLLAATRELLEAVQKLHTSSKSEPVE